MIRVQLHTDTVKVNTRDIELKSWRYDGLQVHLYPCDESFHLKGVNVELKVYPSWAKLSHQLSERDHWLIKSKDGVHIDTVEYWAFDTFPAPLGNRFHSSKTDTNYFLIDSETSVSKLFGLTYWDEREVKHTIPLVNYLAMEVKPKNHQPSEAVCMDIEPHWGKPNEAENLPS